MESHHKTSSQILSPGNAVILIQGTDASRFSKPDKRFSIQSQQKQHREEMHTAKMRSRLRSQHRKNITGLNQYLGKKPRMDFEKSILNSRDKSLTY